MAASPLDFRAITDAEYYPGALEKVLAAIDAGAPVDVPTTDHSGSFQRATLPLCVAASYGKPKVAAALLAAGADPTVPDPESGRTALSHAFDPERTEEPEGSVALARLLLEHSPKAPQRALLECLEGLSERTRYGGDERHATEAELALGRELMARGLPKDHALPRIIAHRAAAEHDLATLELLVAMGLPIDLPEERLPDVQLRFYNSGGQFPATLAAAAEARPGAGEAALTLIAAQPLPRELEPQVVDGEALRTATEAGSLALVRYLLAHGAPTGPREEGRTARSVAELRLVEHPDDGVAQLVVAEFVKVGAELSAADQQALRDARQQVADRARSEREQASQANQRAREEALARQTVDRVFAGAFGLLWLAFVVVGVLGREFATPEGTLGILARAMSRWSGPPLAGLWAGLLVWVALDALLPDRAMHSYVHFGAGFLLGGLLGPLTFLGVTAALGRFFYLLGPAFGQARLWYYLAYGLSIGVPPAAVWLRQLFVR